MKNATRSERWLPVKGWLAYEVSNRGRVRSLPRTACDGRRFDGRVLKSPASSKYATVGLSNGKVYCANVHRLVLDAFVGPCPRGLEACHNNGNVRDNRLENLRWDTRSSNAQDTTRHGQRNSARGERVGAAKLTDRRVLAARRMHAAGESFRTIGRRFGVHHGTASAAVRGESWSHI